MQAMQALQRATEPIDGTRTMAIALPNPALEDLMLAAIIHGLKDLWKALREEGIMLVDDGAFPLLLGLIVRSEDFQRKLNRAMQESI